MESLYNWLHVCVKIFVWFNWKKRHSMLAFLELIPWFKKLKRRASLEFCVHLDMGQIGIVCFTKWCLVPPSLLPSFQTTPSFFVYLFLPSFLPSFFLSFFLSSLLIEYINFTTLLCLNVIKLINQTFSNIIQSLSSHCFHPLWWANWFLGRGSWFYRWFIQPIWCKRIQISGYTFCIVIMKILKENKKLKTE